MSLRPKETLLNPKKGTTDMLKPPVTSQRQLFFFFFSSMTQEEMSLWKRGHFYKI